MSNLPGNPFAEGPDNYRETLHELGKSHLAYEISATLTLAYEQRTATLVNALLSDSLVTDGRYDEIQAEVRERLGLGETR
ncbi:hypothetical protein [Glutamicibacter sp. AOP5-A2-18]|uniref:hypothetical protein n=1 Tax=Glutamicibacter sp. AOP5-A2-18 TaxID=3457656 RepID=UPI004033F0FA